MGRQLACYICLNYELLSYPSPFANVSPAASKTRLTGNLANRLAACLSSGQGRGEGEREGAGEAVCLGRHCECGLKEDARRPAGRAWRRNDWVACWWTCLRGWGARVGERWRIGLREELAWEVDGGAASMGGRAGWKDTCGLWRTMTGWWCKWTGTAGWNGNAGLWTAFGGWWNGTRALWNRMVGCRVEVSGCWHWTLGCSDGTAGLRNWRAGWREKMAEDLP